MGIWHQTMLIVWGVNAFLIISGTVYTARRSRRTNKAMPSGDGALPPISILKPVKGADPGLFENLESFMDLDYPSYEILVCTADMDDPAVAIVQQLQAAYPDHPVRLVESDPNFGFNPKVANLHPAWALVTHDLVLISDSNIRADRDYLKQIVPHLTPGTGTVTAFIRCFGGLGLGGKLEECVWNTFYARWVNLAYAVGMPIVVGKSLLFHRSVVERFGGFSACIDCVGEDFKFGSEISKIGKQIELMNRPIPQFVGTKTLSDFWSRTYRWHFLQKHYEPVLFLLTPLQYPVVLGALTGSWAGWFGTMVVWAILDIILLRSLKSEVSSVHIWLLGQILSPVLWVQALLSNSVRWRGNKLAIEPSRRPLFVIKALACRGIHWARRGLRNDVGDLLSPDNS